MYGWKRSEASWKALKSGKKGEKYEINFKKMTGRKLNFNCFCLCTKTYVKCVTGVVVKVNTRLKM